MKIALVVLVALGCFAAGVFAATQFAIPPEFSLTSMSASMKKAEYWINRYQTFLGVLAAVAVAWFTISAMARQNNISERQFLSGQVQSLLGDRATLQFVIAQLKESKSQKQLFWNNIAFLDTEGDKSVGWQNGPNLIRTAFSNVEGFRSLVSANTAKFMGPTRTRTNLINKLDEIIASQDVLRDAFYKWAILNRNSNADPAAPPSAEKTTFLRERDKVLKQLDELITLSDKAAAKLDSNVTRVEIDISSLHKLISSKTNN